MVRKLSCSAASCALVPWRSSRNSRLACDRLLRARLFFRWRSPHPHPPHPHPHHRSSSIAAFVIASVWGYIPLRVAFSPSIRVHARPPPDILILLLTLGIAATVDGAGRAYETYVYGREWVSFRTMGWCLVDMGVVCALIWVIIVTPLELPSERVNVEKIVSGIRSFGPVSRFANVTLRRVMRSARKITRVYGGGCPFHSSLRSSSRCVRLLRSFYTPY
jgi:hypothetical protein